MKVLMILDQVQSGLGGKEAASTPLGGKKIAMGAGEMLAPALKEHDGNIIGTFYCGTRYFKENENDVTRKMVAMAKKMAPDVVLLGPTFDYPDFAEMAGRVGIAIQNETELPVVVAIAAEKNDAVIAEFSDNLDLVRMPKKGGTGLSDALEQIISLCALKANHESTKAFKKQYCF